MPAYVLIGFQLQLQQFNFTFRVRAFHARLADYCSLITTRPRAMR